MTKATGITKRRCILRHPDGKHYVAAGSAVTEDPQEAQVFNFGSKRTRERFGRYGYTAIEVTLNIGQETRYV